MDNPSQFAMQTKISKNYGKSVAKIFSPILSINMSRQKSFVNVSTRNSNASDNFLSGTYLCEKVFDYASKVLFTINLKYK
jgi:hypothetical protein